MIRNRWLQARWWVIVLIAGLMVGGWLVWAGVTSADAVPPTPWRSAGPYIPATTEITPTVVLDVEASPLYTNDRTLFAATQSGLFRSVDTGNSWQLVLPLPQAGAQFAFSHVRLTTTYGVDGRVIAAYADRQTPAGALYQSTDFGATWQPLTTFTQTVTALALSPNFAQDQTIFAILGGSNVLHQSTDGGQHWQQHRFGPEEYFDGFGLAVSPNYATDHTLFATGFGTVHRSTDGGVTWAALDTYGITYGLAVSPAYAQDRSVWATYRFIEGPGDDTPESAVIGSVDSGATWARTASGLPGFYEPFVRSVAVSPNYAQDQTLFTALSGQLLATPTHALFRSYDRGASWVDLGPPPANPDILDLAVTATASEGVVAHVATTQGVWHFQAPCEERMVNAGFEYPSGWHFPVTTYPAAYSTENQHSGARSARIGILQARDNRFAYSSAQQTVVIPSDAVSVTLHLWWNAISGEADLPAVTASPAELTQAAADDKADAGLAADRQYVLLLNEQGTILKQLLWTRRNRQTWQPLTFDVSAYAGQTVQIHLGVYNDGVGGVTAMFVDDVMLTVCRGATTAPNAGYLPLIRKPATPTATPTLVPTAAPLWPDPPTAIEVFSPLPRQYYRSPMAVNGLARTFEGNVYLRLLDGNDEIIGQHRARAGMTDFAFFHGYLRFEVTQEISATLVVYEAAAADQLPITQVQIPLYLQPGQRFVDLNSPTPGSKICGRAPVAGYASTFEAVVVVELTTRNGGLLEQTNTMGGAWGLYREFATNFDYTVTTPQAALVGATEISPRAGEFVDHVRVPVSLYPAGSSACP